MSARIYFHEDQHFRSSWLWILLAVPIVVPLVAIAASPRQSLVGLIVVLAVGGSLGWIVGLARLETEVRSDGLYVHFHGIWPTRRIPLGDITGYEGRRYTMWESGGWGVHFTMTGIAYNVSGNRAVIVELKKGQGGRVLIGTQRPEELAAAIGQALEARTESGSTA